LNVFVETNFLCELAFSQEQSRACKDILSLAALGLLKLAVPAFSFIEAGRALETQRLQQRRVQPELDRLFREGRRSAIAGEFFAELETRLVALLATTQENHRAVLNDVRKQLLARATIIPTTQETVNAALELESRFGLSAGDAIGLACVLSDLNGRQQEECCFINKNSKDFADPEIVRDLSDRRCRLFVSFEAAGSYLVSRFASPLSASTGPGQPDDS
jgi:predicted nucleic acid-binding protein